MTSQAPSTHADPVHHPPTLRAKSRPHLPSLLAFSLAAILIFWNLGHYSLWDDEALTALMGQAVWSTGDTPVIRGPNIVACEYGVMIRDGKDRYQPFLQFYLAAPFVGLLGNTPLAARLPFALCGVASVALVLYWLRRDRAGPLTWWLIVAGLLCSVATFLFVRQARYYAPSLLLSLAAAYLYLHAGTSWRRPAALAVVLGLLLASHPLNFVAACAVLAADFLLWGRRSPARPTPKQWAVFAAGLAAACGLYFACRPHPNTAAVADYQGFDGPAGKLRLLALQLRDMNSDEFAPVALLLAAPALYLVRRRDPWLLRAPAALAVFLIATAALSPRSASFAKADTRFLVPAIPLCVLTVSLVVREVWQWTPLLGAPLAVVAFGTTLPHQLLPPGSGYRAGMPIRSTQLAFVRELIDPPNHDPFRAASRWLAENAPAGATVWVLPRAWTYPMMYLRPEYTYAWQLKATQTSLIPGLPAIHFEGGAPPDYVMVFHRVTSESAPHVDALMRRERYEKVAALGVYGLVRWRPEIGYHAFEEIRSFDRTLDAVTVFQRKDDAPR